MNSLNLTVKTDDQSFANRSTANESIGHSGKKKNPKTQTNNSAVKTTEHLSYLASKASALGATPNNNNGGGRQQYQSIQAIDLDNLNIDFDDFYLEKVNGFDKERNLFDYYTKMVEPKREETHHLIWFNRNVVDEIKLAEVEQKDLLEKVSNITKEIEHLEKEIEMEKDQKVVRLERIEILEALGRPVEPDITYVIPEKYSKRSPKAIDPKSEENKKKSNNKTALNDGSAAFLKVAKNGEILTLEKRLEDETMKIYSIIQDIEHFVGDVLSEKQDLEKQFIAVSEREFKSSYECYEQVRESEFQCFYLIQELLSLKARIMIAQREEIEELEQLHKDKMFFQNKQEELKEKLLKEMTYTKKALKEELDDCTKEFERQLNELNLKIKNLSHKYVVLKNYKMEKTERQDKLMNLLEITKKRYHRIRTKNALEMEGYQTEITFLQKKLQSLQKLSEIRMKEEEERLLEKARIRHEQEEYLQRIQELKEKQIQEQLERKKQFEMAREQHQQLEQQQPSQQHRQNLSSPEVPAGRQLLSRQKSPPTSKLLLNSRKRTKKVIR